MPTRFAPHLFTLYWIAFTADTKTRLSDFSMKSNGTELEQVFHTDRRSCRSGWTREFGNLNSSPRFWIFTSVPVDSSPHSYLFTSARVRIPVHTAPACGKDPNRYVSLHFRHQCGATSLRYRNSVKITFVKREWDLYPFRFSCRAQELSPGIPRHSVNIA